MTRDDQWCMTVLNTFITAVDSLEQVQTGLPKIVGTRG